MKSIFKVLSGAALGVLAMADAAVAAVHGLNVPEPGSLALVGLAVGVLVFASRNRKK